MSSRFEPWEVVSKRDPRAAALADRHYNRRAIGSDQFVPPARAVVLLTPDADAVWVTTWPKAEYVRHAWPGAWVNTLFRTEGVYLASYLIRQAVRATLAVWPTPPPQGIVTFVDASKVRHKRDPGRCYLRAGWRVIGRTKGGLLALGCALCPTS